MTATRAKAYSEAYVDKADAADALKTAIQTQADDLAKLVVQGTAIGLTDSHAQTYATKNLDTAQEQLKTALETEAKVQALEMKQAFAKEKNFPLQDPNSSVQYHQIDEGSLNAKDQFTQRKGYDYIYTRPFSIVVGTWLTTYIKDDVNQLKNGAIYNVAIAGFDTKSSAVPTEGKATYTGSARHLNDESDLIYNIDFTKQTGSGYLLKSNYGGRVNLNAGSINKIDLKGKETMGIVSTAKGLDGTTGSYSLGFYGPQAQEIAGYLEMPGGGYPSNNGKVEIGLSGTRGDITK